MAEESGLPVFWYCLHSFRYQFLC